MAVFDAELAPVYCEFNEAIAIITLYAAACIPAWLVFQRRRDPFDPRVFFPAFYAFVTSGPCLFKIFVSGDYQPGLKVDWLVPVLMSCAISAAAFVLGGTFALFGQKTSMLTHDFRRAGPSARDQRSSLLVRDIAILAATVLLLANAYSSHLLLAEAAGGGGGGKAEILYSAGEQTIRSYYFYAVATTAALTLAVIADAYVPRRTLSVTILALVAIDFAICTQSGERDFLLVGGVWCLANWRKLSRTQFAIFAAVLIAWLGIGPVLRETGLGFGNQIAAVEHVSAEDWLYSVTHNVPNVHVFTNVVDEVPAAEPFWFGYSLVGAVASFLPGEFDIKKRTPLLWFMDVYDKQGVVGMAFSQDAEAYLNFGWAGPPIWFGICGYLLSVAYRRAAHPSARLFDLFVWWYAVSTSLFGVRSDSRGILKTLVLGMLAAKVLCVFANYLAASKNHAFADTRQLRKEPTVGPSQYGRRKKPVSLLPRANEFN